MSQLMAETELTAQIPLDARAVKALCDGWIAAYFERAIQDASGLDEGYTALWRAAASSTLGGGKRLRPYFLALSYTACGGRVIEDIIPIAAACELLHQCLLIHDDVIDRDYIRHGQPNVAGQFMPRYRALGGDTDHYADSAAILAGDLLLSDVYAIISESVFPGDIKRRLFAEVRKAVYEVAAGELIDVEAVVRAVYESDPIKVAKYKTASYSFVLPLVCGAIIAGASDKKIDLLRQLGLNLGIAFQIQDDILGLFGDESKTGKSTLGDLREGKHTLLIQHALINASEADRQIIESALGNKDLTQSEADVVRLFIKSCGAYDTNLSVVHGYVTQAKMTVDELSLDDDHARAFTKIIDKLIDRDA